MPFLLIAVVVIVIVIVVVVSRRAGARRRAASSAAADPHDFEPPIPTFRVVTLGPSGSGKTVLLSSMFHELSYFSKRRSYFIDTDGHDRLLLNSLYDEVSDTARPWPRATGRSTQETKDFVFRCVGRDIDGRTHTVAEIAYLDFAGVLLEEANPATSESFAKVQEAIAQASAVLVLLDGRRVRQLLDNDDEGHRHFANTLASTLGFAQKAECPLHFVVTKWDLVQDLPALRSLDDGARLAVVAEALLHFPHIKALVDLHGAGSVVRMIPVSSVGSGFAHIDGSGRVVKKADATPSSTNIDVPLAAVVPDFFRRAETCLETQTRKSLNAELKTRMQLGTGEILSALAMVIGRPAGPVLRTALGADYGEGVYNLFIDFLGRNYVDKAAVTATYRNEADRRVAVRRTVQANVLSDLTRTVDRMELHYPRSLLSGEPRLSA